MPRLRQEIAQELAERLFAAETAIDIALARAAELTAAMPQARTRARLPAMIGQDALDRASDAVVALVEARRQMVETHRSLDEVRQQIGLQEVDTGDTVPKVPPGFTEGKSDSAPRARLRAVG